MTTPLKIGNAIACTLEPDPPRAEFLARRQESIGGSDTAKICRVYRNGVDEDGQPVSPGEDESKLAVYRTKVDPLKDDKHFLDRIAMERGLYMEDFVARIYEERTGLKTIKVRSVFDPDNPWRTASADRIVLAPDGTYAFGLEIKCPSAWNSNFRGDGPPGYVEMQAHWYLDVFGFDRWDIICLQDFEDTIWTVERDNILGRNTFEECEQFWFDHVVPRVPPPPEPHERKAWVAERYPAGDGPPRQATPDEQAIAERMLQCDVRMKALRRRKAQLESQLVVNLGNGEKIKGDGWSLSNKPRKGRTAWHEVAERLARQLSLDGWSEKTSVQLLEALVPDHTGEPTRTPRFTAARG